MPETIFHSPEVSQTKICKKCGENKPLVKFQPNRACSGGRQHTCRQCSISPEAIARSERNRYAQHKDKIQARSRQWRLDPEEAYREYMRTRYVEKHDELRQKGRVYAHRARVESGEVFSVQEWLDLCAKYEHLCLACKQEKPLTVDHVIPISKGGSNLISNIQPLCKSCNSKKRTKIIDYREAVK